MAVDKLWDYAVQIAQDCEGDLEPLRGKTVLITGSTGLIGSQLVRTILLANACHSFDVRLVLPVRRIEKAHSLFDGVEDVIDYFEWEMSDPFPSDLSFDYAVHLACTTSSSDFLNKPVEVISSIYSSALNLLRAVDACKAKAVLVSTMEVYGEAEGVLGETDLGKVDPMIPRNSYPEAKKLAECLAASFASEYGTAISVARLAQTFGEGVSPADRRVFAVFGRCVRDCKNIGLLTDGSSCGIYVSVSDAVSAILRILVSGKAGEAYNVANEDTFCTILEMANMVATEFADNKITVTHVEDDGRLATFRKSKSLRLSSAKLRGLGWEPKVSLKGMFERMLGIWKVERSVNAN